MKPQRPYLLRALYEWIVDSDDVPYVLVDASVAGVQVPTEHVEDGKIVLNLGLNAVRNLVLEQDYVMCSSRFGGREFELYLPMSSISAIYGRDTRQGMVFPEEDAIRAPQQGETGGAVQPQVGNSDDEGDDEGNNKPDKPPLRLV